MAKRTTKQSSTKTAKEPAGNAPDTSEGTRSSLISSIYARRYGSTPSEAGVGVTPPTGAPKGRSRRK